MNAGVIYLIGFLSSIEALSVGLLCLSAAVAGIFLIGYLFAVLDPSDALIFDTEERQKIGLRVGVIASIVFAVSSMVIILIPSEEHMIAMLFSSYTTTDNLNAIVEQIKNTVLFCKENGIF